MKPTGREHSVLDKKVCTYDHKRIELLGYQKLPREDCYRQSDSFCVDLQVIKCNLRNVWRSSFQLFAQAGLSNMKGPVLAVLVFLATRTLAQIQAPALPGAPLISSQDRIYTGDQTSNTVTVIKPSTNEVLGTIALGDQRLTDVLGPQYLQSINSHGLGFSRDGRYICSISVSSNTVTVIKTEDNSIISQTFADRAVHEGFFSADNRTVWVASRGTSRVDIIDGLNGGIIGNVSTKPGPSKVLFSQDGKLAYVNHIRSPTLDIIDVDKRQVVQTITGLADVFSSDMMLSADGKSVWVAHKMVGKVTVIDLQNRKVVTILDTGTETNHPNFAVVNNITYGFVTVAALNETKVYRQDAPSLAPIYVGAIQSSGIEPHGLWPSPDNTRMYIVNEHSDTVDVADTATLKVIDTLNVGQEGQALIYVAEAVTSGSGTQNLGRQGLDMRIDNSLIPVLDQRNASALVTVRSSTGLDMVQVIGRNLQPNTTYEVSASCNNCNGIRVPLVSFTGQSNAMGCATAPQVLSFLKFHGVYDIDTVQVKRA